MGDEGLWVTLSYVQIPTLPMSSSVTSGSVLHVSVSPFPQQRDQEDNSPAMPVRRFLQKLLLDLDQVPSVFW